MNKYSLIFGLTVDKNSLIIVENQLKKCSENEGI